MARVLIRKEQRALDEFGVPRQEFAVRPPVPTTEELEAFNPEIALSPSQYSARVPLMDRESWGTEEWQGNIGKKYLEGLGNEGAIAAGEMLAQYPALKERSVTDDVKHLPFIRDYYSRQATLPELPGFESYQTAGPHFDEEGNIIPGQIPPVNAMKIISRDDVENALSRAGNFGLMPMNLSQRNLRWERDNVPLEGMFPISRASFVAPATDLGMKDATAGNTSGATSVVGVRGFGTPSDKAFFRNKTHEGAEAILGGNIPPERLEGVFGPGGTKMQGPQNIKYPGLREEFTVQPSTTYFRSGGAKSFLDEKDLLQAVHDGKVPSGMDVLSGAHDLYDRGEISPLDMAMFSLYRGFKDDPHRRPIEETEASAIRDDVNRRLGGAYNALGRFDKITGTPPQDLTGPANQAFRNLIPPEFRHGRFGFENPILTEKEKEDMIQQLAHQLNIRDDFGVPQEEWSDKEQDYVVTRSGQEDVKDIYGPRLEGDIILRPRKYMRQV